MFVRQSNLSIFRYRPKIYPLQFFKSIPNANLEKDADRTGNLEAHIKRMRSAHKELSIETRVLPIGDALWIAKSKSSFGQNEYVLDFIVGRKRLDDLKASIIDGRYRRQKYYMSQAGISNSIYLIEGKILDSDNFKMLNTAKIETELFDGFLTIECEKANEVFDTYAHLTKAIMQRYNSITCTRNLERSQTLGEFCLRVKTAMNRADTVKHIFGVMMMEVEKLGPVAAKGASINDGAPVVNPYRPLLFETVSKMLINST